MIPSHYNITVTEALGQPSKTYAVDPVSKRIVGKVDGLEAAIQAVTKALNTERFSYVIYDDQYGVEFESLIGADPDYVKSVLEFMVNDALITDDRYIELDDFVIESAVSDSISFSCTVRTSSGNFTINV